MINEGCEEKKILYTLHPCPDFIILIYYFPISITTNLVFWSR
jgi:hypothetical protein